GENEDFPVSDAARFRGRHDGIHRLLDQVVGKDELNLDLRQEVHDVFRAPVELGVALLPPEAFYLTAGNAPDTDAVHGFLQLFKLEGFDDGFDLLQFCSPVNSLVWIARGLAAMRTAADPCEPIT